jgi:D-alanyl-D-alanine carboxypeptidase
MTDTPLMRDPAGLDDKRSIRGGNLLSARDLAIAARAYLAVPGLAAVAVAPEHVWTGGDGKPHSVTNQNRFLGQYEGAIGLKTGATQKAGLTFVAAATRGGRTLIAVVLNSRDHYASARFLLDQGFMLAAVGQGTGDRLPERALPEPPAPVTPDTTTTGPVPSVPAQAGTVPRGHPDLDVPVAALDGEVTGDDGPPREAVWIGAGGGTLVACGGAVVLVRRRRHRNRIDRRPARPRRRDRRRRRVRS